MISLRKINSILVIIMIIILLNHAVLSVLYMYGFISYSPSFQVTGRRLFYPLVAHMVISLYLYIKDKRRNVKTYPKLISQTTQQIVTGILIVVFVALHIFSYMMSPINVSLTFEIRLIHFFIDIGLFSSIILHLRVSVPRLMVSFGFLESKDSYSNFQNKWDVCVAVILILLVLAEIIHYRVIM